MGAPKAGGKVATAVGPASQTAGEQAGGSSAAEAQGPRVASMKVIGSNRPESKKVR